MIKGIVGFLAALLLLAAFTPATEAQSYCYNALPTRLQVGGQGQVTPGLPNILRSQPNRNYGSVVLGQIPAGGVFTVIGGPSCFDGMNWWQVNYNGQIGWTPEAANYGVYWTVPVTGGGCMPVPSRLTAGQSGRVLPGLPNTLRSQPYHGYNSIVLGQIPGGGIFSVIAGPNCSEGMSWWLVNYGGVNGWTPEGQSGTYWLEPYGVVVTPIPTTCFPTQYPHLYVNYTGIVSPGAPNRVRAQFSLNAQVIATISAGETFTVLSGPVCGDGLTWWQINYRGIIGWTVEGQNGQYWLDPLVCSGFQASRLSVGRHALVAPGLPNRLRSRASTGSATLALIPSGGVFSVIGGPVCAESAAWWQVNYQGVIGWTMEGQASQYWLALAN